MKILLLILVLFINSSFIFSEEPIALITKLRGNTKYKISLENKFRSKAKVNTPIFQGNRIKTNAKSFAKIVYLDDRSTVSVYPRTEITINGRIEHRIINKQIDIISGIVRIRVFKQIAHEFKLITPHSELICHACDFFVISDEKTGDRFYKLSGKALIINSSMIDTLELVENSTIISIQDTKMEIIETPVSDRKYLELLMIDADEIPNKSNEELAMRRKITGGPIIESTSNVVEIKLKNSLNIERKIILTYTK